MIMNWSGTNSDRLNVLNSMVVIRDSYLNLKRVQQIMTLVLKRLLRDSWEN